MRPRAIQFENASFCNACCTFCPLSSMERKRGFMSDDLFHKIIKEGKEMGVKKFMPFLNGEPFMDPRIFDWLDYMEKEDVDICLYTNASLLNREKIDRLLGYKKMRSINCSLNAATPETHEKITGLKNFEEIKSNVEYLISKATFPVTVSITVVEDNAHETKTFKKMWGKHAKKGYFVNWAGKKHDASEIHGERIPCYQLQAKLTVLWDGRVCLCCFDIEGQVILGDANKEHLQDIWDRMGTLRKRHKRLDFDMPLCRDCNNNVLKQVRVGGK